MARIGVSISGGGYRASAWGLGVLWYLADAGLNGDVTMVSSVSGGSLTNAHAGWLPTPYTAIPATEYDAAARAYAARLAGRLGVWGPMLAVTGVAAVAAYAGIVTDRVWLLLAGLVAGLLAGLYGAARCGDLLFDRWAVWLWIDGLAALVGLGVWWRHRPWAVALVVLLVGLYLMLRGPVAGRCMGASLRSLLHRSDRTLGGLNDTPLHVILATELHAGRQAAFARSFVYNYDAGLGAKPSLPVHTAVQASSNLPGAFPTRWLRTAGMNLTGGTATKYLALTDGGVYDNMGDEWFTGFGQRMGSWQRLAGDGPLKPVVDDVAARAPDFLVVANASGRKGWRKVGLGAVPLLGELVGLFQVKDVLYTVGTTVRRQWDVERFDAGRPDGTLVHIATSPYAWPQWLAQHGTPEQQARAAEAVAWLDTLGLTPAQWQQRMDVAKSVGTQLWPLGQAALATVVNAAYAQTAVNLHVRLGAPLHPLPYPLA
ncbi:MAG TPA: hypothetical protein VFQ85_04940 [Mycobacteriales bacterium]|nr:hypothetical protein [Mycobacteriales bacterium]